jgi:hypothetical protein
VLFYFVSVELPLLIIRYFVSVELPLLIIRYFVSVELPLLIMPLFCVCRVTAPDYAVILCLSNYGSWLCRYFVSVELLLLIMPLVSVELLLLIMPLVSVELLLLIMSLVSSTFLIDHHCINFYNMYNVINYCHCQNNHFLLIDIEQYNMFNRSDKCLALVWGLLKTLIMHLIILESYSCNCISFIDQHNCRYVVSNIITFMVLCSIIKLYNLFFLW